jgi:predicted nucleotidyltransferase
MTQERVDSVKRPAREFPEGNIAKDAVDALIAALGERLVAAVLFGSRARGDMHSYSDWDILVIAEELPERIFERHLYLKRILPVNSRSNVSLIARTPAEFEASVPSLYLDIAMDGRILYDPRRYATERLARVRRIIRTKGLYRERTVDGDVWRWKKPPVDAWHLEWGA